MRGLKFEGCDSYGFLLFACEECGARFMTLPADLVLQGGLCNWHNPPMKFTAKDFRDAINAAVRKEGGDSD
jgi:hypothetical protein